MCCDLCVEVKGELAGVSSRLPYVGFGNQTQVVRLGGMGFYPLSHLACLSFHF